MSVLNESRGLALLYRIENKSTLQNKVIIKFKSIIESNQFYDYAFTAAAYDSTEVR